MLVYFLPVPPLRSPGNVIQMRTNRNHQTDRLPRSTLFRSPSHPRYRSAPCPVSSNNMIKRWDSSPLGFGNCRCPSVSPTFLLCLLCACACALDFELLLEGLELSRLEFPAAEGSFPIRGCWLEGKLRGVVKINTVNGRHRRIGRNFEVRYRRKEMGL
ncbi:hypothetical protein B0T09DRAFT_99068 [Sordaria sp. MPI-SDFR-AT-0083]|nr:hypothetical protein B0T09DRAFT_99068 [Sordaria sp. MPI-SDFR-AT-0083]